MFKGTNEALINDYLSRVQGIFGSHLKTVILYGSYARGDYSKDSDVDIMLLVDLATEKIDNFSDALSEIGFEFNVNYDIWMMPVVKNIQHFLQWVDTYPFYSNVRKEGVILYEAA